MIKIIITITITSATHAALVLLFVTVKDIQHINLSHLYEKTSSPPLNLARLTRKIYGQSLWVA